jgi:hypothetical protein
MVLHHNQAHKKERHAKGDAGNFGGTKTEAGLQGNFAERNGRWVPQGLGAQKRQK